MNVITFNPDISLIIDSLEDKDYQYLKTKSILLGTAKNCELYLCQGKLIQIIIKEKKQ